VSFGHVCYYESTTTRYFCGGCQHAYGRNTNGLPPRVTCDAPSGFVAWPPHGAFPIEVMPSSSSIQWSFATLEPESGAFNSFTVRINGAAVSATQFLALCDGQAQSDNPNGAQLVQIGWASPSFSVGQTLTVVVTASGGSHSYSWTYAPTAVGCTTTSRPATVPRATCT
jgi:hypothetical protein